MTIMLPHTKVSLRMPIDKYVFQSVQCLFFLAFHVRTSFGHKSNRLLNS
jgi:hypothetical protein